METKATIGIAAPIDYIFNYAAKPKNFANYIACISKIDGISAEETTIGQSFKWILNVAGVTMAGKGEIVKYDPPHLFEFEFKGDMGVNWKFNFFQKPGGTQVDLAITYKFEENPLSKFGDQEIVCNLCKLISKQILENLKVLIESQIK